MKFVDEFRDPAAARALVRSITDLAGDDEFKFMEVCGGHTHTIYRHGIEHLLPLAKRFPHESDVAVFQIPQPAVNQPGRLGGRPAGQIVRLDEADRKSLMHELAGHADAVDAAAEDENRICGELGHGVENLATGR